jgi:Tfp pilus assembly PilM family ATPase
MAPRVELAQECAFVSLVEGNLTVAAFIEGELAFCRSKQLTKGYDAIKLAQEVGSTFLVYRQQHEGHRLREIFLLAPTEHLEGLSSVITDASGQEPLRTEVDRLLTMPETSNPSRGDLLALAAPVGAAVRNLS